MTRQPAPNSGRNDPRALALGLSVYVIWGFFPLYFHLLSPAGAVEVIVHRAVWGLAWCALALAILGRFKTLKAVAAEPKVLARLALAGVLIVVNWSTYVFAIQTGHTVDAAIGYFINPLVTVALGLIVLRERISRLQGAALALGALAVLILLLAQGELPWISLALAFSFALYSLVKKDLAAKVDPLAGMAVETATVAPILLAYYGYLAAKSRTSFQALLTQGAEAPISPVAHLALLIGAGLITVIPLIMFAAAAKGLTLGTLGFIQYVSPGLQMLIGVAIFHEEMQTARWIASAVVWAALAILTFDVLLASRRRRRLLRAAGAASARAQGAEGASADPVGADDPSVPRDDEPGTAKGGTAEGASADREG
ncbi:EamA family transporter RarD [Schaalia hyovaginalis]|uniref:EamA family transporter RarD n=1 Tax=Schaalia hyovaginalis TaxID=29316 RepID=UPI001F2979E5|nr:EamA family transporter RarD [Schaalia hyovaginalis]MCF2710385.1 EamA family transporter RarD [Schaalia hyovaginalis]